MMKLMIVAAALGDDVDAAAIDSQKSFLARLIVGFGASVLLAVLFGPSVAAVWFMVNALTEFGGWLSMRSLTEVGRGSTAGRLSYIAATAATTANWTALMVLCWSTNKNGLQIAAVIGIAGQLVHAQAFCFRSLPVLMVNAGIPALALIFLPLVFGHHDTTETVTIVFSLVLSLGYTAASARSNILGANRLRSTQAELEKLVYLDALTLLGNRRLFAENLRKLIAFSSTHDTKFALLLIDLDRFKAINDNYGHAVGDALLIEVGARLLCAVREGDHVARTGGDEFAVLLSNTYDQNAIEDFCRRVSASFVDAFEFEGVRLKTSLSFGVATYPTHGTLQDILLKSADQALYAAKRSGRGTWCYGTQAQA